MNLKGKCLCGKIQYQLSLPPSDLAFCHCSICRRTLGSAFASYARTDIDSFVWLSGEADLRKFESSATVNRCFCATCGSPLGVIIGEGSKLNYITLGTLEGDPGIKPEVHIFVGSKAAWYEITDDLPQFEKWPPESSEFYGRFD